MHEQGSHFPEPDGKAHSECSSNSEAKPQSLITSLKNASCSVALSEVIADLATLKLNQPQFLFPISKSFPANGDQALLHRSGFPLPKNMTRSVRDEIAQGLERFCVAASFEDLQKIKSRAPAGVALTERLELIKMALEPPISIAAEPELLENRQMVLLAKSRAPDFIQSLREAIRLKRDHFGKVQICCWHDLDMNLTRDESHNANGFLVREAIKVYEQLGREISEPFIYGCFYGALLDSHNIKGALAREILREQGRVKARANLLPGVLETFQLSQERNIKTRILSRNLKYVAEGLGESLGLSSQESLGRTVFDHRSKHKAHTILAEIKREPASVHILIDDSDSGIQSSLIAGGSESISDHIFLIGREGFPLSKILMSKGDSYLSHGDEYWTVRDVLGKIVS